MDLHAFDMFVTQKRTNSIPSADSHGIHTTDQSLFYWEENNNKRISQHKSLVSRVTPACRTYYYVLTLCQPIYLFIVYAYGR